MNIRRALPVVLYGVLVAGSITLVVCSPAEQQQAEQTVRAVDEVICRMTLAPDSGTRAEDLIIPILDGLQRAELARRGRDGGRD